MWCQKQPGKDSGPPGSATCSLSKPWALNHSITSPRNSFHATRWQVLAITVQEFLSVPYPLPFPTCHSGFQLKSNLKLWNAFPQPYQYPVWSPAWPHKVNRGRDTPLCGHSFMGQHCSSAWDTQTAAAKPYQGSEEAERGGKMINIWDYSEPPLIIPAISNWWISRPICPSHHLKTLHMAEDDIIPAFRIINPTH